MTLPLASLTNTLRLPGSPGVVLDRKIALDAIKNLVFGNSLSDHHTQFRFVVQFLRTRWKLKRSTGRGAAARSLLEKHRLGWNPVSPLKCMRRVILTDAKDLGGLR